MTKLFYIFLMLTVVKNPNTFAQNMLQKTAKQLLTENHKAICYGGYRTNSRDIQPTISQIKDDLRLLTALNFKWLRSYNVHLAETENVLKAIRELQKEDKSFEMYLMLGAWIDCKHAWTEHEPIHHDESERNEVEIKEAVRLASQYPDIVKIISVGNEAMVKWATRYYVEPHIILKWVEYLQDMKRDGKLSKDLWITSSDNFASWGGQHSYHNETLVKLCQRVDYISIHTYPMHDTHHNPIFWGLKKDEKNLTQEEQIDKLMHRALEYVHDQYKYVSNYLKSIHIDKPIHIGETGWASFSNDEYGNEGSKATDEYKEAIYYKKMLDWSQKEGITMFYFEAFDECWKDIENTHGSENNFGLFTVDGQAKFVIWDEVDKGKFRNLHRDNKPIGKTYYGNKKKIMQDIHIHYRH
jgi:exo-beta-1,3-glucanase (GH17 family)